MVSVASTVSKALVIALTFGGKLVAPQQNSCPDGGFISTCMYRGFNFTNSNLGMYCLNDQVDIYAYNWTRLDLNLCLANNEGSIIPWDSGYYSDSCTNCGITNTSTLHLTCDCKNVAEALFTSTVDLNTMIYNVDGAMGCCGNLGAETWQGPGVE